MEAVSNEVNESPDNQISFWAASNLQLEGVSKYIEGYAYCTFH